MHKNERKKLQRIKSFEARIKALAFDKSPAAREARAELADRRHWYNREFKGALRVGKSIH